MSGDPTYCGAQIRLRFYEIAAWLGDQAQLAASGYVLDQTPLAQRILTAPDRQAHPMPPLGAYKTYQVPISDFARTAELTMPDLIAADVLSPAGAAESHAQPAASRWIDLHHYEDIVLT